MDREVVTRGAAGGFIGGILMAMFAMIAGATYLGSGFFTPRLDPARQQLSRSDSRS